MLGYFVFEIKYIYSKKKIYIFSDEIEMEAGAGRRHHSGDAAPPASRSLSDFDEQGSSTGLLLAGLAPPPADSDLPATRRAKSRQFESLPRHSSSKKPDGAALTAAAAVSVQPSAPSQSLARHRSPSPVSPRATSNRRAYSHAHISSSGDDHGTGAAAEPPLSPGTRRSASMSGAADHSLGARLAAWVDGKAAHIDPEVCRRWATWLRALLRDRLERAMARKQHSAQRELCLGRGAIVLRVFRKLDPAFQRTLLHYTEPTLAREPVLSQEFVDFCSSNAAALHALRRLVLETEGLRISFQFAYYRVEIHSEIGYLASNQTFDRPIINVWLDLPML
jgi:hypothetical protein